MKFEQVFVLQLNKVEKNKKDFYRELMQIRLNFDPDHHKSIEYEESGGFQWIPLEPNHSKFARSQQARRQDSVTGGAEINFGGHEKFILCEFERGTGAREIYPSLDQINKVRSKTSKGFSGRNRKFKRFFRPKSEIQAVFPAKNTCSPKKKKKKGLHSKNVTKSGVSPQKTLIWILIFAPEATSLLISSGHSPRLGGTIFVWGGTAAVCSPVAPGLVVRNLQ